MFDPASEERTWKDIHESSGLESRDQVKALAASSFEFFMEHVLGLNTNSPVIQASIDFHQNPERFKETDKGTDAVKAAVMAPRGHSKTYSWTIAPILWVAYKEHGKEVLLTSASHSQSKDILEDVKRIIELNDALQFLKPSTENMASLGEAADIEAWQTTWKAEGITTTTDVSIKVKTFSDSIRSKHVDYVFCDDVLSTGMAKDAEKDVFYSVLSPIIENSGGLLQIVGTPLEYNDLMMELMGKDSFYTEKFKAYNPDTEEVLWQDNWTFESLMEKKAEIGPARFTREYMVQPMSVDEQFFDEDVISSAVDSSQWRHDPAKHRSNGWTYFLGVDVALSEGKDADYTVFTVLGLAPDGGTYLVNMQREKGLTPDGIADRLESLDEAYGFEKGLVEKNAIGEGVWRTVEDKVDVGNRIEPFDTTRKTRPEILSNLQAALSRGELKIHDFDPLIREMRGFRMNKKGKLEGREHDDTVMSLAIAFKAAGLSASQASFNIVGEGSDGDTSIDLEGGGDGDMQLGIV